ncbi:MAG: 6-phospho-3-hexuloisomerase [Thermoplasmatota archaeon]
MRLREASHYILNQARASVEDVPDGDIRRFVTLVRDAKNVAIFGRGRSGLVGRALAVRLSHLGIRAYVVGETITPPVHEDDLVVLLSGSGETFSVVVTAQVAKQLGCKVVTITSERDSQIAKLSELVVVLHTPRSERQRELAPLGTLFEVACMLLLDGLVAQLMEELGETEESMRKRHATLE